MSWLGKAGRRWLDLVGIVVALATVVAFALTSEYLLAWIAIGALTLLVVSFAWTAKDEHDRRIAAEGLDAWPLFLERAISDGEALLEVKEATTLFNEWEVWASRIYEHLREVRGLKIAREFSNASVVPNVNPNDMPACVTSQHY